MTALLISDMMLYSESDLLYYRNMTNINYSSRVTAQFLMMMACMCISRYGAEILD
jgi:hypothetical protein